mgnify:CR=1 FL=1
MKTLNSIRKNAGFTLTEVLVAMFISLVIASLLYIVFQRQSEIHTGQTELSQLQQTLLSTLDLMEQEIRLAGYHREKDQIVKAEEFSLIFHADIDNDGIVSIDGDPTNDTPNTEKIEYTFNQADGTLIRIEDDGTPYVIATGLTSVRFEYFDWQNTQMGYEGLAQQQARDQIRRIRVIATAETTTPAARIGSQNRARTVVRDIAPPNLAVTPLAECGTVVVNTVSPLKACTPPGDLSKIQIITYDKDGNLTNVNDVVLSANYNSGFYTDSAGTTEATLPLAGGTRNADTTLYLKSGTTHADDVVQITALYTPPDSGCYQKMVISTVTIGPGDPCQIVFLDPEPNDVTACDAPGCNNQKNLVVEVQDNCGNPVPNVPVKFWIENNSAMNRGTLNGNYTVSGPVELTVDENGQAVMTYQAPNSTSPGTVFIRGEIVNPGAGCPTAQWHSIDLVPCTPSAIVTHATPTPSGCMNRYYPVGVRVNDGCGNPVSGLEDVTGIILNPLGTPGYKENLSKIDGSNPGDSVIAGDKDFAGRTFPGVYWVRYNTRTDDEDRNSRDVSLQFTQSQVSTPLSLTLNLQRCTCELVEMSLPEQYCTRGLSLGCPYDGLIQGRLDESSHTGTVFIIQGDIEFRTGEDYNSGPFGWGERAENLTIGGEGFIPLALRNRNATIGESVSIRLEEYDSGLLQCTDDYTTQIACSKAKINLLDNAYRPAITYDPYDPQERIYVELEDCNRPSDSSIEVTLYSTSGDTETLFLDSGQEPTKGVCYYRNATGFPITALELPTQYDGKLQVGPNDRVFVQYIDTTPGCCEDVATDEVDLVSFCMPMALYSGAYGTFQGTAFRVHWGDVLINGDFNFTGQMKNKVPQKDPNFDIPSTTQPYSGNDWYDRWVDVYIGGVVNGDSSGKVQPFLHDTPPFPNVYQNVTTETLDCIMSKLDYDELKDFALENDVYYYSTGNGTIRKIGDTENRNFETEIRDNQRQFMFIDIIDAPSYTFTGADLEAGIYDAQFPTHTINGSFFYSGFLYIAGNLKIQGLGGLTTIYNVNSPPANDVEQPVFPPDGESTEADLPVSYTTDPATSGLSLDVHVDGSIYTKGYIDMNANMNVFGSVGAERGFKGAGNFEIWYNYAGSRACAKGTCCILRPVPSHTQAYPGEQIQLQVGGGIGGQITWEFTDNQSGGTLDTSNPNNIIYTAGNIIGAVDIITVSEVNGCRPATVTINVECPQIQIAGPPEIELNRTAQYTASGGVAPYTWSIAPPEVASVNSSGIVTALAVGTAFLTATDNNGCSSSIPIGIIKPTTCQQVFFDDFDGGISGNYTGSWTSGASQGQNDWQTGDPTGECGDPANAYSGTNVIGNDLGIGSWDGCYQNNVTNYIVTPFIDLTGYINPEIHFRRWLTVRNGDFARVQFDCGSGFQTAISWTNVYDTSWQEIVVVAPTGMCDNVPDARFGFQLQTNASNTRGGWTIDDVYVCGYLP